MAANDIVYESFANNVFDKSERRRPKNGLTYATISNPTRKYRKFVGNGRSAPNPFAVLYTRVYPSRHVREALALTLATPADHVSNRPSVG